MPHGVKELLNPPLRLLPKWEGFGLTATHPLCNGTLFANPEAL